MVQVGRPYAWEKSYPAGMRWDCPIATSTLQELLDRALILLFDFRVIGQHADGAETVGTIAALV